MKRRWLKKSAMRLKIRVNYCGGMYETNMELEMLEAKEAGMCELGRGAQYALCLLRIFAERYLKQKI